MIGIEALMIFIIVSLAAYYVVVRWKKQRFYELAAKLPGHRGLSFLESLFKVSILPRKEYVSNVAKYIKDEFPMTKVWFFNELVIVTKDADFINKVFNLPQTYNKPKMFYNTFMATKGLIVLTGAEHKRHRKILNKAFTSKMMQRLPDIFDEKSKKIIEIMSEKEGCGEFELTSYIGPYSFETIGKSNLNYEIEYYGSEICDAFEQYPILMGKSLPYVLAGVKGRLFDITEVGKQINIALEKINKFANNVVRLNDQNNNDFGNSTFIELLMDSKNGFDDRDIIEELRMMLLGNFETSTKTISIVLMMLGMYKDVQQKVTDEIEEIYSTVSNHEFTTDFLQKFSYLEMVIKEVSRLFTIVPMVARETSEEVAINGYLLPKGANILICTHEMHTNEKYWGSDAHIFRPERFIDGPTNPLAYAPFTGGSRICIGYRYAMISMKIFLINFLQTYKVDCSSKFEDLEAEMTMTTTFVNGYKVSIQRK